MRKTDLEKIKKALQEQLKGLQADFSNEVKRAEGRTAVADVNDQATLESERAFELRIRDRERKLVSKVSKSLQQIDEGTYGICEACEEPINVKRLLARPVTTYCINCKSELEAEERQSEHTHTESASF